MNTATDPKLATEPTQNPMSDTLGRLEGHMNKIHAMVMELQSRLLGPSPEALAEQTSGPSHILGRLQVLDGFTRDIGNQLEGLIGNL